MVIESLKTSAFQETPAHSPQNATQSLSIDQCTELFKNTLKDKSPEEITQLFAISCAQQETALVTSLLIKMDVNPNTDIPHFHSKVLMPPIFTLMQTQSPQMCREVIMHPETKLFCSIAFGNKKYGVSLLHSAILQGKLETVRDIFASNKYPTEQINESYYVIGSEGQVGRRETPLSLSTRKFQPEIMQVLIQSKANIYQESPDKEDCLVKATRFGSDPRTLSFLLSQEEVLSNKKHTALLHALAKNRVMTPEACRASTDILLAHGNPRDILDCEGHTPLYTCMQNSKRNDLLAYLLNLGADLLELYLPCENDRAHISPVLEEYKRKIQELCRSTPLIVSIRLIVEDYLLDNDALTNFLSNLSIHYMQE